MYLERSYSDLQCLFFRKLNAVELCSKTGFSLVDKGELMGRFAESVSENLRRKVKSTELSQQSPFPGALAKLAPDPFSISENDWSERIMPKANNL